ncbi:CASP-like protein 2U2 [Dendrobium catenatum]|uniref:CASP-like protein 2U2 n=1 Tax=Dendrobium catenatum TaxID=906689 RepID=UPI0010A0514B|nr:CASP-like protein 2U2 [Dendrobium catenatum]
MKGMERRLRVSELAIRLAAFGFAVTASALVGSDREVRMFFSLEKRAKFTDMKVFVFLVAANGILAGYNLLQLVRCFVGIMKGGVLFGKGFAFVVFSCDQGRIVIYSYRFSLPELMKLPPVLQSKNGVFVCGEVDGRLLGPDMGHNLHSVLHSTEQY